MLALWDRNGNQVTSNLPGMRKTIDKRSVVPQKQTVRILDW